MEDLNQLERELLENILKDNRLKYPFLESHFPYLKVSSREKTGVGIYTNFIYSTLTVEQSINDLISSDKQLFVPNLDYELSYVLSIENGKVAMLEIVTNDEEWSGEILGFSLI